MRVWKGVRYVGDRWPRIVGWFIGIFLAMLVLYAVLAAVTSVLTERGRESCERGNASRLVEFRKATNDAANAERFRTIYQGRHDPEVAAAWNEKLKDAETQMDGLKALAEATGTQTTKDAVTISCPEAWPKPVPWFEGDE